MKRYSFQIGVVCPYDLLRFIILKAVAFRNKVMKNEILRDFKKTVFDQFLSQITDPNFKIIKKCLHFRILTSKNFEMTSFIKMDESIQDILKIKESRIERIEGLIVQENFRAKNSPGHTVFTEC